MFCACEYSERRIKLRCGESNILEYVLLLELCINNVALEECEKS